MSIRLPIYRSRLTEDAALQRGVHTGWCATMNLAGNRPFTKRHPAFTRSTGSHRLMLVSKNVR